MPGEGCGSLLLASHRLRAEVCGGTSRRASAGTGSGAGRRLPSTLAPRRPGRWSCWRCWDVLESGRGGCACLGGKAPRLRPATRPRDGGLGRLSACCGRGCWVACCGRCCCGPSRSAWSGIPGPQSVTRLAQARLACWSADAAAGSRQLVRSVVAAWSLQELQGGAARSGRTSQGSQPEPRVRRVLPDSGAADLVLALRAAPRFCPSPRVVLVPVPACARACLCPCVRCRPARPARLVRSRLAPCSRRPLLRPPRSPHTAAVNWNVVTPRPPSTVSSRTAWPISRRRPWTFAGTTV